MPQEPAPYIATLVVISCGKAKLWDRALGAGPHPAKDAYTGSLFRLCRRYAEARAPGAWAILSAKYGFLHPDDLITQYNTRFGRDADAIGVEDLRRQWLERFPTVRTVVSLASNAYDQRLIKALPGGVVLERPLRGKNLFQRSPWLKSSIADLVRTRATETTNDRA